MATDDNKLIQKLQVKLNQTEAIICRIKASKWQVLGNGELVLTNERICFYRPSLLGETFETIPIGKITSLEFKSMLGIRRLTLHTSHDDLEIQLLENKVAVEEFQKKLEQARDIPRLPEPNRSQPSDLVAQIKSLAELRDSGLLTEEEFSNKKAELLDKM